MHTRVQPATDTGDRGTQETVPRRAVLGAGLLAGTAWATGCVGPVGDGGGTLTVTVTPLVVGEQVPWTAFETLRVRFDRCVLTDGDGSEVVVDPSDSTVDLATMVTDETVAVVDSWSVQSGEYRTVEFYVPVETARTADGEPVGVDQESPLSFTTGAFGQYLTVDSGDRTVQLALGPVEEDGTWALGASFTP